jgi:hypothetical protein
MYDATEQAELEAQLVKLYQDGPADAPAENPPPLVEEKPPEPATQEPVTVETAKPEPIVEPEKPAKKGGDLNEALRQEREARRQMQAEIDRLKQEQTEWQKMFEPEPEPVDPNVQAFQEMLRQEISNHVNPLQQRWDQERQEIYANFARQKYQDFDEVTGLGTLSEEFPAGDPSHPVVQSLNANPIVRQQLMAAPNQAEALYQYAKSVMAMRPDRLQQTIDEQVNARVKVELEKAMAKFMPSNSPSRGSIASIPGAPQVDDFDLGNVPDSEDGYRQAMYRFYQGE